MPLKALTILCFLNSLLPLAVGQWEDDPINLYQPQPKATQVDQLLGNPFTPPTEIRPQATLRQIPNYPQSQANPAAHFSSMDWPSPGSSGGSNEILRSNQTAPLPRTTPASFGSAQSDVSPVSPADQSHTRSLGEDLLNSPITPLTERANSASSPLPSLGGKSPVLMQTIVALTIVIVLVVGAAWLFKKTAPQSLQALSTEAVQVLGNAPLTTKQHLKLLRLGNRLLLLAVSDTNSQTLAEISDPDEVRHLLELTQGQNANSAQQTFRSLLSESERDRASGFLGSQQDRILKHESRSTASPAHRASRPSSVHTFEA